MRAVYCCLPPYIMIGSDLSGIEARMLGHFASYFDGGELAEQMLKGDIHQITADSMGVDRNTAKTIRYALMYGAGVAKVMTILGCNKKEADAAIESFYDASPGLKMLNDSLKAFYKKHKYIKAINGTRLQIRSEHVLLNSLIQASSAIIFKRWGCNIWDAIDEQGLDAKIIISLHDEWQLRAHKDHEVQVKEMLKSTLEKTREFYNVSVELKTDSRSGANWSQTH